MDKTVGVLGGGQLGRMLAEAANRLNIKLISLDKANAPTKQITAHSDHVEGSFKDSNAIRKIAEKCDVLTIEIEHVSVDMLQQLETENEAPSAHHQVAIHPSWATIKLIQDKFIQKQHLTKHEIPVADFVKLSENTETELDLVARAFQFPFMLKSRVDAYDGRGNFVVDSRESFGPALAALGNRPLYAERWAPFKMELAVMVVQTSTEALAFPTVETIHENSICKLVFAPPRGVSDDICLKARQLASKTIATLSGKGVFAVEMFLLPNDELLVNEIAPRPHNSGHYTIEGCYMSQFEAHLHAILDLPIPQDVLQLRQPSIMLNILGGVTPDAHMQLAKAALQVGSKVHLYGKGAGTLGRKMGHITITAPTMSQAESRLAPLLQVYDSVAGKKPKTTVSGLQTDRESARPVVAVLMGSDSDLPIMEKGIAILRELSIPYTVRITSAHRTPKLMFEFANNAAKMGIKVIIAGAGGAAHLPGMVASETVLPVIGVPVRASVLDGLDSLLSIVQMPRGIPVATVGISNSTNAAILAAKILGVEDLQIRNNVEKYQAKLENESTNKDEKIQKLGSQAYLEQM